MTNRDFGPRPPTAASPPLPPPTRRYEALAERLVHLPDQIGIAAVPVLRGALNHPGPWVRRHAVAALARIDDAGARAALVRALHDESFGVHWAAAEALAATGRVGVEAVLRAMLHDVPSTGFLHAAAHVLGHASLTPAERTAVAPVLDALNHPAPDLEGPVLAATALSRLVPHEPVRLPDRTLAMWYERRRRPQRGHIFAPMVEP